MTTSIEIKLEAVKVALEDGARITINYGGQNESAAKEKIESLSQVLGKDIKKDRLGRWYEVGTSLDDISGIAFITEVMGNV